MQVRNWGLIAYAAYGVGGHRCPNRAKPANRHLIRPPPGSGVWGLIHDDCDFRFQIDQRKEWKLASLDPDLGFWSSETMRLSNPILCISIAV